MTDPVGSPLPDCTPEQLVTLIETEVLKVLRSDALYDWWTTPVPAFDGWTPASMFKAGQGSTVLSYAQTYSDPSFS